jgi:phosphoribosylglycinamide formyltransferase 1
VVSSRSDAFGVQRARNLGLPCHVVARKDAPSVAAFSDDIFRHIREAKADLVCLAGFLSLLEIPPDFSGRVINIHPALLPSFGGKGMHGHHVHEAVLKAGCKVSGCTVHLADQTYDTGRILVQRCCPVLDTDTPDTLAKRVFEQECIAYPEAIRMFLK